MSDIVYSVKCLLIGDTSVGKSSILERFVDNTFCDNSYTSTIGIDFKVRMIEVNGIQYRLQLWDTAGQERFKSITQSYYRGVNVVFICFSLINKNTFNNVSAYVRELEDMGNTKCVRILVGTFLDLTDIDQEHLNVRQMDSHREVSTEEAEEFAGKHGMDYVEISSKTGEGINNLFVSAVQQLQKAVIKGDINLGGPRFAPLRLIEEEAKSKWCCYF